MLSDVLVILDEVQFPQGTTWINRNRFKNDQGALWLTIPVWKKGLGEQTINQVRICWERRWPRKHLQSLKHAYGKAPYLHDHLGFIEGLLASSFEKLADLNLAIISYLLKSLQIPTRMVRQSEMGVQGRASHLLLEICKTLGASGFLAQSQAHKYLDADLFRRNGIELHTFRYVPPVYPQLWGDFLPNLSTFDVLFTCGPKARAILMSHQPGVK